MDIQQTRNNIVNLYDPKRDQYDVSWWSTISGAPSISANKLLLTAAEIVSWANYRNGAAEFFVNVPTAPAIGDVRAWGFKSADMGNKSRMEFDITGAVFSAQIFDESGAQIGISYPINWLPAWTGVEIRCRVFYWERNVFFSINNVTVAKFEEVGVSKLPNSLHIINSNADSLLIGTVAVY